MDRIRLFVYGTLCPGRPNHHLLAGIDGTWSRASVRGRLRHEGWGSALGYPALTLDPDAAPVAGYLLESDELDRHWQRLDDFEGAEYRRVVAPIELDDGSRVEAFVYVQRF